MTRISLLQCLLFVSIVLAGEGALWVCLPPLPADTVLARVVGMLALATGLGLASTSSSAIRHLNGLR